MGGYKDDPKKFSSEFKARVALKAIRGQKTLPEISAQYKVHSTQIARWKQKGYKGSIRLSLFFLNGPILRLSSNLSPENAGEIKGISISLSSLKFPFS